MSLTNDLGRCADDDSAHPYNKLSRILLSRLLDPSMPKLVQIRMPINLDISMTGESTISANPKARVLDLDLGDFLPGNNGTEDTPTVDVRKLVRRDHSPQPPSEPRPPRRNGRGHQERRAARRQ